MPLSENSKTCQVCGLKSHGIHYGADTCRACAAFFRRVAAEVISGQVLKCRKNKETCKFVPGGLPWCKKCRMEKCEKVGMNMKNFQFNRDCLGTMKRITPAMAISLGRPQFTMISDCTSTSKTTFFDLKELLNKATKILSNERNIPLAPGQNRLQKLTMGLNTDYFRSSQEKSLNVIINVGLNEAASFWEYDILAVSKWLAHFDEFLKLEVDVKVKFLKTIWHIWTKLEKLARLAMFEKCQTKGYSRSGTLPLSNDCVLDLNNMKLNLTWLTDYSLEYAGYYLEYVGDQSIFEFVKPIVDLNPNEVELNYMLAQISFSYAAKELDMFYSDIAENFLQILADDLHDYYINQMNTPMYSKRLIKMMKVNNSIMEQLWKQRDKLVIARAFGIFKAEFSEPEMFKDVF